MNIHTALAVKRVFKPRKWEFLYNGNKVSIQVPKVIGWDNTFKGLSFIIIAHINNIPVEISNPVIFRDTPLDTTTDYHLIHSVRWTISKWVRETGGL